MQDLCREVVDLLVPARRRASRERRSAVQTEVLLARKISPSGKVLAGPFAGMVMPDGSSWAAGLARLAGSYEEELTLHLRRLIAARPAVVVDAGASEGYYAAGIARLLPDAQVFAYEMSVDGRRLCHQAAQRNGLTNITVCGRITPRQLRGRLRSPSLLIADVEGYELELLDPLAVPNLTQAYMLVELHEYLRPGVTDTIVRRFEQSHTIQLVDAVSRSGAGRPSLAHLTVEEADQVVDEGRPSSPCMQWAIMFPNQTAATPV